jgi:hypothetical protein
MVPTVGQHYIAKVAGNITIVKFDEIYESRLSGKQYLCTNLKSGRQVQFKSTAKFRRHVPDSLLGAMREIYG